MTDTSAGPLVPSVREAIDRLDQLAYRPAQAAKVIGLSRAMVYRLISEGQIAARAVGAATLITRSELVRWLESLPPRESA